MTGRQFYDIVRKGVKPTIVFTETVTDLETQFEAGMIADIVSVTINEDDDLIMIIVDESNYVKYNKTLETSDWYNNKTGEYNLKFSEKQDRENVIEIYDALNEEICNIKIQPDGYTNLQKEYIKCESELYYVEWLQEEVLKLRELGSI